MQNTHILCIPKPVWLNIGLFLRALYRHNLSRTCKALNPISGMFKNFRENMNYSNEYQIIRQLERVQQYQFNLHVRVTPLLFTYNGFFLSMFCSFIENGNDWQTDLNNLYIRLGASKCCIAFLTAIGIMNVYQYSRTFFYPSIYVITASQFNKPELVDDALLMLRQFDSNFINVVLQNFECLSSITEKQSRDDVMISIMNILQNKKKC